MIQTNGVARVSGLPIPNSVVIESLGKDDAQVSTEAQSLNPAPNLRFRLLKSQPKADMLRAQRLFKGKLCLSGPCLP